MDSWSRAAIWGVLVAVASGLGIMVLQLLATSMKERESAQTVLDHRITILETEHQPWRRHMGGAGIVPNYDHPGRTVENPTSDDPRRR